MNLPREGGRRTIRTSHIRSYGAAGMTMHDQEDVWGCPRQYRLAVQERAQGRRSGTEATYGQTFHRVLQRMEDDQLAPEEALREVWPAGLPFHRFAEAVEDLDGWLSRDGWHGRYATVATEQDLRMTLGEVGGEPLDFAGRLDVLAVDESSLVVVDYKTNRAPTAKGAMSGDVQMMGYAALARANADRYFPYDRTPDVRVVLDAVKWFESEHRYPPDQLEVWAEWVMAIAARILEDDTAEPALNPGCTFCDFAADCPAILDLPDQALPDGLQLAGQVEWADRARLARKVLDARIRDVDRQVETVVRGGQPEIGPFRFSIETKTAWEADMAALHDLLGVRFYDLARVSKTASLAAFAAGDPVREQVRALFRQVPTGTRVVRTEGDDDG
jgi:hypothetical protein